MKEIHSESFEKEVLETGNVIIDFYSTECPPCEALAPKFEDLAEIYGSDVKFLKIFRQENRELATQLGITSSPSLVFFKDGKKVGNMLSGGIQRSQIVKELNALVGEEKANIISQKIKEKNFSCDVAIIGAGPAGLTAGIYLGQAKINTIIIDLALAGGNVKNTHLVSNFPGFIDPQPGYMLSHFMGEQAKNTGVNMMLASEINSVDLEKKTIYVDGYKKINAKYIIIATGTSPKLLEVPGEKALIGKGISFCATCDAKYYENKEVVVIGGGNSAVEESEFITKFASKVNLVYRGNTLKANKEAVQKLLSNEKMEFLLNHDVLGFSKDESGISIELFDKIKGENKIIKADGIFTFAGLAPELSLFGDKLGKNESGYIITDEKMQTNLSGVFAIGDVREKECRQITTAVSDGTIAGMMISKLI